MEEERIAVVTGGNKGIGLEICRQLATKGVTVILTARDEQRGNLAVQKLREESGLSNIIFHQLDVTDRSSIASLADFVKTQFRKLDILVNNAGIIGITVEPEKLKALRSSSEMTEENKRALLDSLVEHFQQTYDMAEECLKTNYHGTKEVAEALMPFLLLSNSGRIVNVSSSAGKLKEFSNQPIRQLSEVDGLTEESFDQLANLFLKDLKDNLLIANGWPTTISATLSAYRVSKALVNAYTRVLAKRYPTLCINCVCPGYVETDINFNTGILTVEEGARGPVMLALLPEGGPSGLFFDRTNVSEF